MDKVTAISMAALATAGVGTGFYYSRGGSEPDLSTPPYLAQTSAKNAFIRLTAMSLPQGLQPSREEAGELPEFVITKDSNLDRNVSWHMRVDGVDYMIIHAELKPVTQDQTAIEVTVDMPDSPFSRSPSLHPYDLELIKSVVDLAVTDHIQSIFETRRPTDMEQLTESIEQKIDFKARDKDAMRERMRSALEDALAPLKDKMDAREAAAQRRYMDDRTQYRARMMDARDAMRRASAPTATTEPMIDTDGR